MCTCITHTHIHTHPHARTHTHTYREIFEFLNKYQETFAMENSAADE